MLPRLRTSLDFMPSPIEDKPGLLIRDPFQYSDATLIIPPALVGFLEFYDGQRSALDLRAELVRAAGDVQAGEFERQLSDALSHAGFLEDENYERLRAGAERAFAEAPVRRAAHAGGGYPDEAGELSQTMASYLAKESTGTSPAAAQKVLGIALPGVRHACAERFPLLPAVQLPAYRQLRHLLPQRARHRPVLHALRP